MTHLWNTLLLTSVTKYSTCGLALWDSFPSSRKEASWRVCNKVKIRGWSLPQDSNSEASLETSTHQWCSLKSTVTYSFGWLAVSTTTELSQSMRRPCVIINETQQDVSKGKIHRLVLKNWIKGRRYCFSYINITSLPTSTEEDPITVWKSFFTCYMVNESHGTKGEGILHASGLQVDPHFVHLWFPSLCGQLIFFISFFLYFYLFILVFNDKHSAPRSTLCLNSYSHIFCFPLFSLHRFSLKHLSKLNAFKSAISYPELRISQF